MGKEQGDHLGDTPQEVMVRDNPTKPGETQEMLVSSPAQRVRAIAMGYRSGNGGTADATNAPATGTGSAPSAQASAPAASGTPESGTARGATRKAASSASAPSGDASNGEETHA